MRLEARGGDDALGGHGGAATGTAFVTRQSTQHTPTVEMPTDLPYAADAEESLGYEELEVR